MSAIRLRLGLSERCFVVYSRTTLIVAAAIGFIASPAFTEDTGKVNSERATKTISFKPADEWKIQIVPGTSASRITPVSYIDEEKIAVPAIERPATTVRRNEPRVLNPEAYREIYNSIPFSRAEYLANRDYRHEATMEILFGQLRTKVVVQFASPATETRTSYSHQSLGRPGGIAPTNWTTPMLWSHWMW